MKSIWSYFIVVLYLCVTSAKIMDFPGNRNRSQDNLLSTKENEKILTPPTTTALIIDSNGFPGNSNGEKLENIKPQEVPPFVTTAIKILFNQTKNSEYEIVPFSKEDIINMEKSDLCKIMCEFGVKKPPCKCK